MQEAGDGPEVSTVGDGHEGDAETKAPSAVDGANGRTRLARKVVSIETLHLASEALECTCIEAAGWWYGEWIASPFEPATGPNNERYWYSPAAKAVVKAEVEAFQPRSGGRQTLDLKYELVSYRVK